MEHAVNSKSSSKSNSKKRSIKKASLMFIKLAFLLTDG
jgi:hypothetical protein